MPVTSISMLCSLISVPIALEGGGGGALASSGAGRSCATAPEPFSSGGLGEHYSAFLLSSALLSSLPLLSSLSFSRLSSAQGLDLLSYRWICWFPY